MERIAVDIYKFCGMFFFYAAVLYVLSPLGETRKNAGLSHNVSLSTCSVSNRHARKPLNPSLPLSS